LVFEKNANFFAENWQKSQKIVIIISTPGSSGIGERSRKVVSKLAKARRRQMPEMEILTGEKILPTVF
jgi:hypothetical protein